MLSKNKQVNKMLQSEHKYRAVVAVYKNKRLIKGEESL